MKRPILSSRRLLLVAGALFFTLPRDTLDAQGPGLFDAFAARKESPSDPLFAGIGFTGFSGMFGLRVSGALNFNNGDNGSVTPTPNTYYGCDRYRCRSYGGPGPRDYRYDSGLGIGVGGWTADADLLIAPLRALPVAKSLLLGFSPFAFVGIGGMGINPSNAADTSRATWSYGVGVHHDLLGWLGVSAEARNRRSLHSDSAIAIGSRRSWEYRAGLSLSFGGHRDEIPSTAPRGIIMPVGEPEVDRFETAESAARITARVLDRAEGYVNTPYRSGSTNPNIGFDAAGFVQYVFGKEGVSLPRTAHAMAEMGEEISTRVGSLRPGDLLFFGNDGSSIDHVAIYAGHDRIIHATASGGGVRYDELGEGARGEWFADHLVTARRIVAEGRARPRLRRDGSRDEGDLDPPDRAPRAGRTR
jgi:cell wall-associated NlpC family hydrolase